MFLNLKTEQIVKNRNPLFYLKLVTQNSKLYVQKMNKVNIPKNVDDFFYRYTRHTIQVSYLSKRNGVTCITNLDQISKEIERECKDIIKFFQKKCGLSILNNSDLNVYEINSKISVATLEEYLEEYISKYVLCSQCGLPETDAVTYSCHACGFSKLSKQERKENIKLQKKKEKMYNKRFSVEEGTYPDTTESFTIVSDDGSIINGCRHVYSSDNSFVVK